MKYQIRLLVQGLMFLVLSMPVIAWAISGQSVGDDQTSQLTQDNPKQLAQTDGNEANGSDTGQYGLLLYYANMTDNTLGETFISNIEFTNAPLIAVEPEYRFSVNSRATQFVRPVADDLGIAMNFTYQDDPVGPIYQINPFLFVQWCHFPWNRVLPTTFRFGEGVSYASKVPFRERRNADYHETERLLNFLVFELGFSWPGLPQWQGVVRYHHRSGAFGLYGASNTGSTAVGIGIRYIFPN